MSEDSTPPHRGIDSPEGAEAPEADEPQTPGEPEVVAHATDTEETPWCVGNMI
jgi:hypothetical protein